MKHPRSLTFIAALLWVLSVPCFANAPADATVTTLPGGLTLIVREGHAVNLAAVDVWVKAGSINETPENNGVSHFIEHMIFKATARYGPGELDRVIEGLGAELNGGTSKDYTHFYTTVASEYLPIALDVLADAIARARFDPDDLEKERGIILDEIARAESDPIQRAFNLLAEAAYPAHPYGLPSTGTRDSIRRLTRQDLVDYYSAHYTQANTCVVIVGDVSASETLSRVQTKFADLRAGAPASPPTPAETEHSEPRVRRITTDLDQAYVTVGFWGPSASEFADTCALDVLLAAMGDTYQGRIYSMLTEQGIAFTRIVADFTTRRDSTTFSVLVAVDPRDSDKARAALLAEFKTIAQEGLAEGELNLGKRLAEGSDIFEQETFAGQARALGLYHVMGSHDMARTYAETVRNLTRAQVAGAARKYLGAGGYTLVLVGPQVPMEEG